MTGAGWTEAAEARAARTVDRILDRWTERLSAAFGERAVRRERGSVRVRGRGLGQRRIADARLRFLWELGR